jgi:AraC-like DNA-binding protein
VPAHGAHRARVDAALVQIERSCHKPLALADLAAAAGLSPFHFLRVFRTVTGTTPHQYVVGARLRRAARVLVDTSRPVTEIAYEVGFEDLSNFVRTFHRVVGCSPSAFRARPTR